MEGGRKQKDKNETSQDYKQSVNPLYLYHRINFQRTSKSHVTEIERNR